MSSRAAARAAGLAAVALLLLLAREREEVARVADAVVAEPAVERPSVIRISHVELPESAVSQPPLPPLPRPRPAPPRPARSAPAPAPVDAAVGPERPGRFPRLRATYERLGFPRYRDALLARGAAFYLYDSRQRRTVARVDPRDARLLRGASEVGLSRWPRDVTRHAPDVLAAGRARYGSRVDRVVLLPPARVDEALLDGFGRLLRSQGVGAGELVRVDLAYQLHAGRLQAEVLAVGLRDGRELGVRYRIDLEERGESRPPGGTGSPTIQSPPVPEVGASRIGLGVHS